MVLLRSVSLFAIAVLAGCNARVVEQAPVEVAAAAPSPALAEADLPKGNGCGPSIARTRAIVDSDVATGNIDTPVGQRFAADLDRAGQVCAAGREAEALRLLAAAKVRYGYR